MLELRDIIPRGVGGKSECDGFFLVVGHADIPAILSCQSLVGREIHVSTEIILLRYEIYHDSAADVLASRISPVFNLHNFRGGKCGEFFGLRLNAVDEYRHIASARCGDCLCGGVDIEVGKIHVLQEHIAVGAVALLQFARTENYFFCSFNLCVSGNDDFFKFGGRRVCLGMLPGVGRQGQ